ncbi:MAG: hypothetical protein K2X66_13375 [Cyanobacteria bacterium]|nr:hypothetical protein [Cyanobacteriota bacterium]
MIPASIPPAVKHPFPQSYQVVPLRFKAEPEPKDSSITIPASSPVKVDGKVLEVGDVQAPLPKNRKHFFVKGLKNLILVPVLPLSMYYGLDATGVTDFLGDKSEAMKRILGEGFGHAGLCFSLHYVFNAGKSFWQALTFQKKKP